MSTRGLRLRRPCPGTTTPRVLRALAAAAAAAVAETKMAGSKCGFRQRAGMVPRTPVGARGIAAFLRNVWAKEPVIVASLTIGGLAIILPALSPYIKYSIMINEATPYNYPVPLRDDGNMPDVPSHPQDPQGPSLEWLKKL
ncbi:NADH dehydrogenase [ubiquinone] 1 alpha subcomplex subunit 3 isoform X1 [Neophocaena asiaeorientalis asiaeorientalis]|uniref:NADH dehydrogenase [ubiquinone] 1 alpha subcomplex subunit 3 n=1 Tax=Neophocaena asiaeorientalis asiaeorientalis TaxID=1706337 RepID=A0A341B8I4_NEOAA|nr:NADH dehydrogenase [ubiquinone] 1 alpha subcomplex subunit 3 isoform X1 [Neophocaena asiaeorientalis asiaeorientalis]